MKPVSYERVKIWKRKDFIINQDCEKRKFVNILSFTWLLLFQEVPPRSNSICMAAKMQVFHLLLVTDHQLEPLPIHRTTIIEIEIHHENCRNFDRPVQHDRRDFSVNIVHLNRIPTICHLN